MLKKIGTFMTRMGMGKLSDREYRANLTGINMFFGAVLGVVLAGIEKLNSYQFGLVLVILAGIVISIIYISTSRSRIAYAIYATVLCLAAPRIIDTILHTSDVLPSKVVPTLLAWTLMTIVVEFWSREQPTAADPVGE